MLIDHCNVRTISQLSATGLLVEFFKIKFITYKKKKNIYIYIYTHTQNPWSNYSIYGVQVITQIQEYKNNMW